MFFGATGGETRRGETRRDETLLRCTILRTHILRVGHSIPMGTSYWLTGPSVGTSKRGLDGKPTGMQECE